MATIREAPRPALSAEDVTMAVHGPWHPAAQCAASPTPLWHPRVETGRLRALWAQHRGAIEAAAAAAGMAEPWIVTRLAFCDAIEG
jgi:hypothetical protein